MSAMSVMQQEQTSVSTTFCVLIEPSVPNDTLASVFTASCSLPCASVPSSGASGVR